jgi:hypothetical protein
VHTRDISSKVSLCARFNEESTRRALNIGSLGKPYSQIRAERLHTRYGISILLSGRLQKMPCVYSSLSVSHFLFSGVDIDIINDGMIKIDHIYQGTSEKCAYQFSLKMVQK